jgi:biopolymer transport protein ExbD
MRRLLREEVLGARPVAEINMTNLIDVTLTLLILFILIAPVVDQGMELELPVAGENSISTGAAMHLVVNQEGLIHLKGRPISDAELAKHAAQVASRGGEPVDVVILADRRLLYGRVIEVMDVLRSAGLTRLALATREETTR